MFTASGLGWISSNCFEKIDVVFQILNCEFRPRIAMVLVCQLCANYSELSILEKNVKFIMQRRMLTNKNSLILRESGKKNTYLTSDQEVACSNHAGCTNRINDLRPGLGSAAFLLRQTCDNPLPVALPH